MSAALVRKLKENEEDFEFYPTTTEILTALYWDINGPKTKPGLHGRKSCCRIDC